MGQADAMLMQRLSAIRAEVRRRLVLYGVCAVASGGLLSFTTIVLLDWLLWLPSLLRVVGGVLFFAGFVLALWHWVGRPLRTRLSLNAVAGKLERHFFQLGDSLTSAVSFLESSAAGSEAMMRRVIDGTGAAVASVPLEKALTRRPLMARAATLGVGIVLAGTIMVLSPGWYATGLARYVDPFGEVEWPRNVQLVPEQGDVKVALGDALTLRMNVARGMSPELRGVVRVRDAGGTVSSFAMQRDGEAGFYFTLDGIGGDLSYWFEAGDDSTARRAGRVLAVKRPVIVEAAARVEAPAYAQPREPVELDLSTGTVRAAAGSRLTVSLRCSKPVGRDAEGHATARVDFGAAGSVPLSELGDPTRLTGTIPVVEAGVFQLVLRDEDGFENQDRREYRLEVEPDRKPTVTVLEPPAVSEVTPNGSVALAVRAEDDFGVQSVALAGDTQEGGRPMSLPLFPSSAKAASAPSGNDSPNPKPDSHRAVREVRHALNVAELSLRAGDVLVYRAEATDNYSSNGAAGKPGQTGASAALRLKIIGAAEFEGRLRDEFALLEKRVRQSVSDQESLRDEVEPLSRPSPGNAPLGPEEVELARRSAQRQHRLAQRIGETAERFSRIAERMRMNQAFDQETRAQVAEMTGRLRQTSETTMAEAARALDGIESAGGPAEQRERAAQAESRQSAAAEELQEVIRWMGRWGDFQEVVARTRDLLDRQQEVRAATLQQGAETVGAAVDALTDAQKAALKATVRDQQQLARDLAQWLRASAAVRERVAAKDPAAGDAMAQAMRLANAQQVLQRMENAAEAVEANRTAGAALEQRAAEAGLTAMLAALEERQARELAELKKSVERLQDAVLELLRQEEGLLAANVEAGKQTAAGDAFERLAGEQRAVRRNTEQVGQQAGESPATAPIGKRLEKAAAPMGDAETQLKAASSGEAAVSQRDAVTLLKEAAEELQKLADQTDDRRTRAALAAVRRKLEEIRGHQEQEINTPSAELVQVVRSQGRLDRARARRASKVASRQGEVRVAVGGMAGEMENAAVYGWVLERVGQAMEASGEALTARKLDDALIDDQRDIVTQLNRLVDALAAIEKAPPPDQFAEGQAGGGAQTGAADQPPVPPVAELIVLKAMQESLRERTAAARKAWGDQEPSEADLRRAKKLGEEQEQLRVMTEQVTQQARATGAPE